MHRTLKFLGTLGVATASCYLAYQVASFVLFEWPRLVLALVTDIEFAGWDIRRTFALFPRSVWPHVVTRFPPEGSASLYALYRSGALLWGAALLGLGVVAARRARGWWRLFWVQTVFWPTVPLVLYSGIFVGWSSRSFLAALRVLWPGWVDSLAVRTSFAFVIGIIVLSALYVSIRSFLDSAAETRLERVLALVRWLVLPTALVALLINFELLRYWGRLVTVFTVGPPLLVLLAGLPAALARSRPAPRLQPSLAGVVVLLVVFGITFGGWLSSNHIARLVSRTGFSDYASTHWRLQFENGVLDRVPLTSLAAAADKRLTSIAKRLGLAPPNPALSAYLYASTETKRVMVGSDKRFGDAPFSLEPGRRRIHHLLALDGSITDARGDALLLMHTAWERPGSEAVARALARYAVGDFHGAALADYAARITREEAPYTLRDIFQLDSGYLSPLVRDALGGAWVDLLVRRRGQDILPVLYRELLVTGAKEKFARTLGSSWEGLERAWRSYQLANADRPLPPALRARPAPFFHRGISFSHEFGGAWGYGSDRAQQELVRIQDLGANAIAAVPYAFTRAPRESRIFFRTAETDARVIRTLAAAKQLGLRTMLKPQLWGRVFTGDIVFDNEAAFARWFAPYRRWLLHFARLAELYDADLLVVGTELSGVTRYEGAWRALIRDLRRVYRGPLTYAAHWGNDFEELPFWDALDYLGVNMYYPLAAPGQTPRADSPRVQDLVRKFAALADKYKKPVLFSEVGYPATATAAAEPWKERGAALDPELQQRCYATVFEAFYHQPWFAGLYWWKWPSHGGGNRYQASYNPIGKPAAEVLARWYGKAAAR
ncbi:MAG: hypothetical protein ACE5H2_06465 [Terriglobia bacterium]